MANMITGVNSGIDVDAVVKQSLLPQQNKIDKAYQQQKIYEYQQEQLKEIVNQCQSFYDKYLDILSPDSLLRSSAYETATFTGIDSKGTESNAVTAKGYAGADVADYKVTVTQLAKKASITLSSNNLMAEDEIEIKIGDKLSKVKVLKKENSDEPDYDKTVKELNADLKKNGINVCAKYSEFSRGIVLESGEMGENISFQYSLNGGTYQEVKGQNARGAIIKGDNVVEINSSTNNIMIDNVQFSFNAVTTSESKPIDVQYNHLEIKSENTTTQIEGDGNNKGIITQIINNNNVITYSTTKVYDNGITVKFNNDNKDKALVYGNLNHMDIPDGKDSVTSEDGKIITTKSTKDGAVIIETTQKMSDGTEITTITSEKDGKKEVKTSVKSIGFSHLERESDGRVTIESNDGRKKTIIENGNKNSTEILDDGSIVKVTKESGKTDSTATTSSGGITLSGKTDISKLKDTIVNFVNDYNKLMENINAKLWETRDKNYMPLTDEQKNEMSDKEVELWEKKATTGLLRNDSDLLRIQSAMKTAMSSMMSSTGLTLESIGIKPIDNYTTKNGMFKIDEDTLTKALQNNAEEVKDLFTRAVGTEKDKNGNLIDKGGVLTQLQTTLKNEVKLSSSALSKRIGFEGTSTENSNTLSKSIAKQKSLITQLKEKYSDKEKALYKKYSSLEVMLEKLNAQTNSLYAMLGIG